MNALSVSLRLTILLVLIGIPPQQDGEYVRHYHPNGNVKAAGWVKDQVREGYWYFYADDGTLEREGHYSEGRPSNWWIYYDAEGKPAHKCQLEDGMKNGYCLKYTEGELSSASRYSKGRFVKEWKDLKSFKRENSLLDLY